jgi:hypothetical protein
LEWAASRIGISLTGQAAGLSAVDGSGRTRGVVVFDGWTPSAAQVHLALDTPMALRCLIRRAFLYVFKAMGRQVLWMLLPASSPAAGLAESFGFRLAHEIRDGFAVGDNVCVFEMRREECRWLRKAD